MQQPDPARDRPRVGRRRSRGRQRGGARPALLVVVRAHEERDVPRVDGLARAELAPGAAPQFGDEAAEFVDDEVLTDLLVVDAEHGQEVLLVAEVAEGPVAEVVQQAGEAQRLFDDRQRRRAGLHLGERGVHLARQLAGEVHRAEAVGEAAVLGGREHPPRALQLVDALEALDPRVVDDVCLRDLAGARERDAQIPVQGVGDEMDVVVGELHGPKTTAGPGRPQGAQPLTG